MQITPGHFLWAIGGKHELGSAVNDVAVYSIDHDCWLSFQEDDLAPMPHAVQGAGWTIFDNKIYAFGGKTGFHKGATNYVQVYDIAANQWTVLDPMPAVRSKLGKFYPVVADRYLYLFGGDDSRGHYSRVNWNWRFDLKTHIWDTEVANAPLVQSFPLPTLHDGWLYFSTGNTGQGAFNSKKGAINQRYHPEKDKWEVMQSAPLPVTDGEGDKYKGELHFLGGWNANPRYYNRFRKYYQGRVKKQHLVYNYEHDQWRFEKELPGSWHHGGCRAAAGFLWRYLGTIDEDQRPGVNLMRVRNKSRASHLQHSNKIFRWDGDVWEEMTPAPVKKMNFSCVYSRLGPVLA